MAVEKRPRAIRSVPLRALLVAELVSTTGSQMTWVALPWFVLVTSRSPGRMSLVVAAEAAGYAIFGIPSGTVLQRLGGRTTMLAADGLRAPLMLLIPILHWANVLSLAFLLVVAFLIGTVSTPYGGAQRVLLPELLGEDEALVGRANALFQAATRMTLMAGPPLAGVLIAVLGAPAVLVIDSATYAVAFLLVLAFVPLGRERRESEAEEAGGVLEGLRYLGRDRLLRSWATAFAIGDGAFQVLFVAVPVLVFTHFDAEPQLVGVLFGAWGVGAVAGNVVSYRYLTDREGFGVIGAFSMLQALPLWLLAAPVPARALGTALVVSGLANGLVNPTIHSLFTLRPPPAVRAKVITASYTASTLAAPAALLVAGPALSAFGSRAVLAAAAGGQTVAVLLITVSSLRERATAARA